jgi:hypothetical protein
MTMQHQDHPHDERLAALAGGDPEAVADRALIAHAQTCERCRALVDELANLTSALAELPEIVPPRRLQLVPPATEASSGPGLLGWLRTLTAPAMAVGAGLVLVGAIGLWGTAMQASAGGIFANVGDDLSGAEAGGSPRVDEQPAAAGSPVNPAPSGTQGAADRGPVPLTDTDTPAPWLTLLVLGMALLLPALVLRFSISPRAG